MADLVLSRIIGSVGQFFRETPIEFIAVGIIIMLWLFPVKYFFFEVDSEIVTIKTKTLVGSLLGKNIHRYEFPKRLLKKYKYQKSGRILEITLKSTKGADRVRKFKLLFIKRAKIKIILKELEAITISNKNNN